MKKLIRRLILWAFKDYITGIGLDHHLTSNSWVVFNISDSKQDYVTFLELRDPDIRAIQHFLSQFSTKQVNIDRNPTIKKEIFF